MQIAICCAGDKRNIEYNSPNVTIFNDEMEDWTLYNKVIQLKKFDLIFCIDKYTIILPETPSKILNVNQKFEKNNLSAIYGNELIENNNISTIKFNTPYYTSKINGINTYLAIFPIDGILFDNSPNVYSSYLDKTKSLSISYHIPCPLYRVINKPNVTSYNQGI